MSTEGNDATTPAAGQANSTDAGAASTDFKGKGKATPVTENVQDLSIADDDNNDEEEEEEEEGDEDAEGEDEEDLKEIDPDNVLGKRTRGKVIDFAKAAEENPPEGDEDEDDDEDFAGEDDQLDED